MTVTKYITAGNLAKVMEIPIEMQDSLLEVTVRLAEEKKAIEKNKILKTIDSLCGVAPDCGKTIEEYRKERLGIFSCHCEARSAVAI